MIRTAIAVINDFSGGQDTKTPIISMGLNKSPNMRNFHCSGVKERLMKRGGYAKVNSSAVESDNLDVHYSPGYQAYDYPLRTTAAYTQIAQGFKCNTSSTVTKVRLWLKKVGTPAGTDTITLEIQSDSAGVPSGAEVTNGVATAVDISDTATLVTTGYSWVTFTFATAPSLTVGTQYHLVLTGAFTVSDVNYILWGADNYDVIYQNGSMSVYDGSTWVTDSNYDACFEVYITGGAEGSDGFAIWDFSSKSMLLGVFGTTLYKMDKNSAGTPDETWDVVPGGSSWDSYTKLVSNFDGDDAAVAFTDPVAGAYTFQGTAQLDTAIKKFGTAALLLDGDSDYITQPHSVNWALGAGDFTLRCHFYKASGSAGGHIFHHGNNSLKESFILQVASNTVYFYYTTDGVTQITTSFAGTINTETWYHLEIVRSGNNLYCFLNGTQIGSTADLTGVTLYDSDQLLYIGCQNNNGSPTGYWNGSLDEIRIDKGIARHTANFTAPIAAYSGDALPLTSSRYWTFADWQSGRALINTDIGLYTYIGTGNASAVSAAPLGKFMTIWRKYVFMAGIRASPNTTRYSDLSDYATWTAANTLNFDTNDGDVITGMRTLKGKLYIFKRYSVHRVTYLGSNPTFQVDPVLGIGTPSHYSIKEVDMGGELGTVLVFLTTDKKLAIFDGYNVQVINDNLTEETNDLFATADDQPLSFADMNLVYSDLFHAVVKQDTYEYILYCVLGSDTSVNYAFVLDYKTGGVYPYDGQVFSSSCYAISTNKSKLLYTAGYTGYMWQMESGNSDDSSAINAYWVSGKIKPALVSLANKMLMVGLNLKEAVSASVINLSLQYRTDWNVSWTTAESHSFNHNDELAFGKTSLSDIGTINNMFQIKLKDNSTNPAPTIYGIDLYGEQLGLLTGDRAES